MLETMTQPVATETPSAPICATQACKRPLTRLGPPQNCWRCLVCNPIKEIKPTERPKRKYMDVKMTEDMVREIIKEEFQSMVKIEDMTTLSTDEDRIREIVQDELANWHIQRPPATRDEIAETIPPSLVVPQEKNWRQKAKELGIPLHKEPKGSGMRKKMYVLADIAKQNEASPEGDTNDSPVTAGKGA